MLSIITVTYNSEEHLPVLLQSILEESCLLNQKLEVILVDNASMDNTVHIINKWTEIFRSKGIKIKKQINSKNYGFGKACNSGVDLASGDILFFINPDVRLGRGVLEYTSKNISSNSDFGIVTCRIVDQYGEIDNSARRLLPTPFGAAMYLSGISGVFKKFKFLNKYLISDLPGDGEYEVEACSGAYLGVKKNIFLKIKGFDEKFFMYGEDLDLCLRVRAEGYKVVYLGKHSSIHYRGKSSVSNIKAARQEFYRSMWLYFDKHFHKKYFIFLPVFKFSIAMLYYVDVSKRKLRNYL